VNEDPRRAARAAPLPIPLLRGVSHQIAAFISFIAGTALVLAARTPRGRWAALVYGASLCTLFSVSAVYHRRRNWSRRARRIVRRLDHSAIYLLIAGTYTPIAALVGGTRGTTLLAIVWSAAVLGILKVNLWTRAPKKVGVALYVLVGWTAAPAFPALAARLGAGPILLFLAGGLAYTVGAVVYATRRPNPYPRVFGYHEVFHALVVAAATGHFLVAAAAVERLG